MNRRNLIVGSFIVAAVALLYVRSQNTNNTPQIEENVPISDQQVEEKLEQVLGRSIADDAEKVTLKDTTSKGQTAIATRAGSGGVVEFTVLADLEDSTEPYQVWAGNSTTSLSLLGTLSQAKGGYLFEYRQSGKLDDYNQVVIKLGDANILEGSF